jgi:hypothetical protein
MGISLQKESVLNSQSRDLEKGNTVILICKKLFNFLFAYILYYFFGKAFGIKTVQKYRFFQLFENLGNTLAIIIIIIIMGEI